MFRFGLLTCLIGLAQSCQLWTGQGQNQQQASNSWIQGFESTIWDLAQSVIEIDQKMEYFCNAYASHVMQETYGKDFYQLSVNLKEYTEDNIMVKIMHRIILVSAEDCSKRYADLKMLPDVVDGKRAVWKYWKGELIILIPYMESSEDTCGEPIDSNVIIVPKQTMVNCVASCSRRSFDDGIIRDNVWHLSSSYGSQGQRRSGQKRQGNRNNGRTVHNGVFGLFKSPFKHSKK